MTWEKIFSELQNKYLSELPDKINRLQHHADQKNWKECEDILHQLKGTGKSYGFKEISQLAEIIEDSISLLSENKKVELLRHTIILFSKIYDKAYHKQVFLIDQDPQYMAIKKLIESKG